jgi:glycosyltransferase involved in cell wall biosynthesis
MRIAIDLQGVQSENRSRGTGRYAFSLARALLENRSGHEVILVLSGLLRDSFDAIRSGFDDQLPKGAIRIWHAPGPIREADPDNTPRREAAELLREGFLSSLQPDLVLVPSLFEGFADDAATSVGRFCKVPTAVVLYGLTPPTNPALHLRSVPGYEAYYHHYHRKLDYLRKADLLLAVSDFSRREAIRELAIPPERIVTIGAAAASFFCKQEQLPIEGSSPLGAQFGLIRPFLMGIERAGGDGNLEKLVEAFALLPTSLRSCFQLALVGTISSKHQEELRQLAGDRGLAGGEVVMTGHATDEELRTLYSSCSLFIFPALRAGFASTLLEAMACGAPVLAANSSSVPEIVNRRDLLFDPLDAGEMSAKMAWVLANEDLRSELSMDSAKRSAELSWEKCAHLATTALEELQRGLVACPPVPKAHSVKRKRLAFISPLPPEKTGVATYSAALLPELLRHYEIEVITPRSEVGSSWVASNCTVRSPEWFRQNAGRFDRTLYQFGNSPYHSYMFDLLDLHPGVVVLHDFFLSSVQAHDEDTKYRPVAWTKELLLAHGYCAVAERLKDPPQAMLRYPCNLSAVRHAQGVIVHSMHTKQLASFWYGSEVADSWRVIPHLVQQRSDSRPDRSQSKRALGLPEGAFLVCSFGVLNPNKHNELLIKAWEVSALADDPNAWLIFVGEADNEYGQAVIASARASRAADRIRITGWTSGDEYHRYLGAADLAVQLRTNSRGETSGAIWDCMSYGLPILANAHGSIAELPEGSVLMLPDVVELTELTAELERLRQDEFLRRSLGRRALEECLKWSPRHCADLYAEAIEQLFPDSQAKPLALPAAMAAGGALSSSPDDDLVGYAQALAKNFKPAGLPRQLFVDISPIVVTDLRTGVERFTRGILRQLLRNPPDGCRVEPVYAVPERPGYFYARQFTLGFLGYPATPLGDEPIDYYPGDIFLGLDLACGTVLAQQQFLRQLREDGAHAWFVVQDLLPVLHPEWFPAADSGVFAQWLRLVETMDGAICVSANTAADLKRWLTKNGTGDTRRSFAIAICPNAADIEESEPSRGIPEDAKAIFAAMQARPSFLMVGTVEPRKGHFQAIRAFDLLWKEGFECLLIVVGKRGWMVEAQVSLLESHPELGKRLFWLKGISDEYLEELYRTASCLICASEGEGFGLPLIEGARHGLPLIARDIPVFREVAGEGAFYFSGAEPADLASAIKTWLELAKSGSNPSSAGISWLTWKQSADRLKSILFDQENGEFLLPYP